MSKHKNKVEPGADPWEINLSGWEDINLSGWEDIVTDWPGTVLDWPDSLFNQNKSKGEGIEPDHKSKKHGKR